MTTALLSFKDGLEPIASDGLVAVLGLDMLSSRLGRFLCFGVYQTVNSLCVV